MSRRCKTKKGLSNDPAAFRAASSAYPHVLVRLMPTVYPRVSVEFISDRIRSLSRDPRSAAQAHRMCPRHTLTRASLRSLVCLPSRSDTELSTTPIPVECRGDACPSLELGLADGFRCIRILDPEPEAGQAITEMRLRALEQGVEEACNASGLKMCLVLAKEDVIYYTPHAGSVRSSKPPPGGISLYDVKAQPEEAERTASTRPHA